MLRRIFFVALLRNDGDSVGKIGLTVFSFCGIMSWFEEIACVIRHGITIFLFCRLFMLIWVTLCCSLCTTFPKYLTQSLAYTPKVALPQLPNP